MAVRRRRACSAAQVVGIDCVDDESKPEGRCPSAESPAPPPHEWTEGNPHYAYYCYYIYANLFVLNQLRCAAPARPAPAVRATEAGPRPALPSSQRAWPPPAARGTATRG